MKAELTTCIVNISLYESIDIILKIVGGIILVVFINNRNNKSKKKEILYDLFINLIKCHQEIRLNSSEYIMYLIYFSIYTIEKSSEYDIILKYLAKKSRKYSIDYKNVNVKINEFLRTKDTIELILGINRNEKKLNKLAVDCQSAIFFPVINAQENFDKVKQEIIDNLYSYFEGAITLNEAESMNEDAINIFERYLEKEYLRSNTVVVRNYIKVIKNKIDKL